MFYWPLVALILLDVVCCKKPNVLMLLADDYGWADVGYHREKPTKAVQTPNIDRLATGGLELDRHYVFKFCSPTRSSFNSGRNPVYVNVLNIGDCIANVSDPVSGYMGIPRNMTGIAQKMKDGGYKTHMMGKWHVGMATPQHTPLGRGYDTSLHYFDGANKYWTSISGSCKKYGLEERGHTVPIVDLWKTDKPAFGLNNSWSCSQEHQGSECVYEDQLFLNELLSIINNHDPNGPPFFIYWTPHVAHTPLNVPQAYVDKFSFMKDYYRQYYHAMVNFLDDMVGQVEAALKKNSLWDDTLWVFSADNGGPIYNSGHAGANNYPLRGGKRSNWEGGIRVNGWVNGGFLPAARRGQKEENYIHISDWYATFCHLAGVDPTDHAAASAGLPPIDSFNMWDLISGSNTTGPRDEVIIGDSVEIHAPSQTLVGGLISGQYKILLRNVTQAIWTGPDYPNKTNHVNPNNVIADCGFTPETGCLFDIKNDPTEHFNIAAKQPALFKKLLGRALDIQRGVFSPKRGVVQRQCCHDALHRYQGFWGPWMYLSS